MKEEDEKKKNGYEIEFLSTCYEYQQDFGDNYKLKTWCFFQTRT